MKKIKFNKMFLAVLAFSSSVFAQQGGLFYPAAGHNKCICTFDMDLTIVPDPADPDQTKRYNTALPGAQAAIQVCMAHHCGIAINTSRGDVEQRSYSDYWNPGLKLKPNVPTIYDYIYGSSSETPQTAKEDWTVEYGNKVNPNQQPWRTTKAANLPAIIEAYSHNGSTPTKYSCIFHFDDYYPDLIGIYGAASFDGDGKTLGDKGIKLIYVRDKLNKFFDPAQDPDLRNERGIWYQSQSHIKRNLTDLFSTSGCFTNLQGA